MNETQAAARLDAECCHQGDLFGPPKTPSKLEKLGNQPEGTQLARGKSLTGNKVSLPSQSLPTFHFPTEMSETGP